MTANPAPGAGSSDVSEAVVDDCPFCRSDAHLIPTATPGPMLWQVQCEHCGAATAKFAGEQKALDAWNERARPSSALVERIAQFVRDWNGETADGNTFFIADEIELRFAHYSTPAQSAGQGDAVREALVAILAAQNVQPYRGWNITKLNDAVDKARALLGLPSIRDLNPDVARMQDAAEANGAALRELIATPPSAQSTPAGEGVVNKS